MQIHSGGKHLSARTIASCWPGLCRCTGLGACHVLAFIRNEDDMKPLVSLQLTVIGAQLCSSCLSTGVANSKCRFCVVCCSKQYDELSLYYGTRWRRRRPKIDDDGRSGGGGHRRLTTTAGAAAAATGD